MTRTTPSTEKRRLMALLIAVLALGVTATAVVGISKLTSLDSASTVGLRDLIGTQLLLGVLVALLVLGLTWNTVNRLQRRLDNTPATDPLTGLPNHAMGDLMFDLALRDAQRNRQALSLVLMQFDDRSATIMQRDEALRKVGALLAVSVRKNDVVSRDDFDTFSIAMRACPMAQAVDWCDRMHATIESEELALHDGPEPAGARFGIATLRADDNLDTLHGRAEAALHAARTQGRMLVVSQDSHDAAGEQAARSVDDAASGGSPLARASA
jgi:diguanylate cyclase (GGDEF)-like protein